MKSPQLLRTLIILGLFLVYKNAKYAYAYLVFGTEQWQAWPNWIPASIMLATGVLMAMLSTYFILHRIRLSDLGLSTHGLGQGLLSALLSSLPMFLGLGFLQGFTQFQPDGGILYRGIVLAGFGEEFLYRAFLFGLLFYHAGWGFLSAGLLTGLFFGYAHLYQAHSIGSGVAIFLFTTGASLGFAWFYYVWQSLWMALFLHGLMDLIWDSYGVDTNVTGSLWVNVARFSTLGLAIFLSVRQAKKTGRYDLKKKWWLNPYGTSLAVP